MGISVGFGAKPGEPSDEMVVAGAVRVSTLRLGLISADPSYATDMARLIYQTMQSADRRHGTRQSPRLKWAKK